MCLCVRAYDERPCVAAGTLPGAGDGAHSIGVAGAPGHTAHVTSVHLPYTNRPVLKAQHNNVRAGSKIILTDKKHLMTFALESHVSNVTVIVCLLFRFSLSSLSAERLDCVNALAHLCTAHKEKAPFEHIQ